MLDDFVRETTDQLLERLSAEQRLRGLPAEALLKVLSVADRLKGLSPEQRLEGLSAEQVLEALPGKTLEALTQQLEDEEMTFKSLPSSGSASTKSCSAPSNGGPSPRTKYRSFLDYALFMGYRRDLDNTELPEHLLDEWILTSILEILEQLSPEERIKGLPVEALLKRLSRTQRLQGLSPEQRLDGLSADEIVRSLPPKTLEALSRQARYSSR